MDFLIYLILQCNRILCKFTKLCFFSEQTTALPFLIALFAHTDNQIQIIYVEQQQLKAAA